MTQNVGRLGVVLGLDTAAFVTGLNAARKQLTEFAVDAMPKLAAAGAAAFTAMTYKALQFADQIDDVAKANEMAIASVLQLSQALQQAGGRYSDAGKMLSNFNNQLDSAAQGSKGAQEAFARVGISLSDIRKMTTEELFQKTIQQLGTMNDVTTRNAASMALLGKAVRGVDIKTLAAGTREAQDEFIKYQAAIEQSAELMGKLEIESTKVILMFTNSFIPTLNTIMTELGKTGGILEQFFNWAGRVFKDVALGAKYLANNVIVVVDLLRTLGAVAGDMLEGNFRTFSKRMEDFETRVKELNEEFQVFYDKITNPPEAKPTPKQQGGREVIDANADQLVVGSKIAAEFERQNRIKLDQLKRQADILAMTQEEKRITEAVARIEEERANKVADLENKIAQEKAKGSKASADIIRQLETQKELVNEIAQDYKNLTAEQIKAQEAAQNTFMFGWDQAFRAYTEEAKNAAKIGTQVFETFTDTMDRALQNFVRTGKMSFREFARDIIQQLLYIQMRAAAMNFISMMFGNIRTAFSYGTNIGSSQTAMLAAQEVGFADGGRPPVGEVAIVGERGPELFVPDRAGTIIPNHQMSSALGGTTNITNNYIDAIDVKSFEERILGSSNAVWAANQYAGKSLAVGRGRT